MTYTRLNASAATLTKNRTEDSVSPFSGMCTTCIDGCIGMCEIGKSAYRGPEMIYPQPFGIITTASQKDYPVDLSHFTILGRCAGAWGVEPDSNKALFPNVNLEADHRRRQEERHQVQAALHRRRHGLHQRRQEQLAGIRGRRWPSAACPWPSARTSPAWT